MLCISQHAVDRARQASRGGISVTPEMADLWVWQIFLRRARFVVGLDRDRSIWDVSHQGQPIRVVYSRSGSKIVTVLPVNKRTSF